MKHLEDVGSDEVDNVCINNHVTFMRKIKKRLIKHKVQRKSAAQIMKTDETMR